MTGMREGQAVSWIGPEVDGYRLGDTGRILAFASTSHAHVQWITGAKTGVFEVVEADFLAGRTAARDPLDSLEDSLEHGGIATFGVRQIMDAEGEAGVLNAMASVGHLATFASIAEDIMGEVSARIRKDPSFVAVASHLDDEENEALISLATTCLIRDAFTEEP